MTTNAYQQMIFFNLPVADLQRSRRFYAGLGFTFDDRFCDDTGACVVISDTIYLMILTREKFASFAPRPISDPSASAQHLIGLSSESPAEVDRLVKAAVAAGGADNGKTMEMGDYMYGRSFSDPDGHVFEPMWMDVEKAMAAWGQAETSAA